MKSIIVAVIFLAAWTASASASEGDLRTFVQQQEQLASIPISEEERSLLENQLEELSLLAGRSAETQKRLARQNLLQKRYQKIIWAEQKSRKTLQLELQKLYVWYKKNPNQVELFLDKRKEITTEAEERLQAVHLRIKEWFLASQENILFRYERKYERILDLVDRGYRAIEARYSE